MITHIAFHLPAVPMDKMILAVPGQHYELSLGVKVHALGKPLADGSVTWSCSYRLELPGGPNVLLVGANLHATEVEAWPIDVMVLSPRNPEALEIVRKVTPALVLLDDAFACQSRPDTARIQLRSFLAMQTELLPTPTVLLAPGESWTVRAKK